MGTTLGRPTLLTKDLQQRIYDRIIAGNYAEVAARACGISRATFYNWKRRGEDGEQPYADFVDAVKSAEAEAECESVLLARQAGRGWQAHAWFLERKYPQRWAQDRNKKAAEIALLKAKLAGDAPPDTVILSPGDAAFDELMKRKWGGVRQGTTTTPKPPAKDDGGGREPQG